MDYPTYQDGYFIGDTGTDDDDMINRCWKFHSHDSYTCETDCLALGDAQGSILEITYAGRTFGTSWDRSSGSGNTRVYDHYAKGYTSDSGSNLERFNTFNGVFFIATFLAFSVARGSRLDASEKSRSLLSKKDRKKGRSSSRKKSSSRSKSSSGKKRSSSSRYVANRSDSRNRSSSRKLGWVGCRWWLPALKAG